MARMKTIIATFRERPNVWSQLDRFGSACGADHDARRMTILISSPSLGLSRKTTFNQTIDPATQTPPTRFSTATADHLLRRSRTTLSLLLWCPPATSAPGRNLVQVSLLQSEGLGPCASPYCLGYIAGDPGSGSGTGSKTICLQPHPRGPSISLTLTSPITLGAGSFSAKRARLSS